MLKQLQPTWKLDVRTYGHDNNSVIIIDGFMPNVEEVRSRIRTRQFARRSPYYPGVQSPIPTAYLTPIAKGLEFILKNTFGFESRIKLENLQASYVTTPPDKLAPIQRYPHYDGGHDGMVALLHYLCGPEQGGTNFYRHDRTGWETVTRDRDEEFGEARKADVEEYGLREGAYFRDTGHGFTLLESVPAAFNRAILYSSSTLHSGDLGENPTFATSPETGRLTVNTFVSPA